VPSGVDDDEAFGRQQKNAVAVGLRALDKASRHQFDAVRQSRRFRPGERRIG
jgi:hypothetical protein